jgi:hypothetical protein
VAMVEIQAILDPAILGVASRERALRDII